MSESPQEALARLEREFGAAVRELGEFDCSMPRADGSHEGQDKSNPELPEDFRGRIARQEEHSRLGTRVERLREQLDWARARPSRERL